MYDIAINYCIFKYKIIENSKFVQIYSTLTIEYFPKCIPDTIVVVNVSIKKTRIKESIHTASSVCQQKC